MSDTLAVVADGEEMEVFGIKHLVLLCECEDDSPQVTDQPRVNALVASVRRHQNVWDFRQEAFERELVEVGCKRIFIDVDNLVRHCGIHLNLLVPIAHSLIVGVLDAALNIAEQQGLSPPHIPLSRRVLRFRVSNGMLRAYDHLFFARHVLLGLHGGHLRLISRLLIGLLLRFVRLLLPLIVRASSFVLLDRGPTFVLILLIRGCFYNYSSRHRLFFVTSGATFLRRLFICARRSPYFLLLTHMFHCRLCAILACPSRSVLLAAIFRILRFFLG